ncbi:MBL fold metallo-hydrolase [Paenibacillus sp. FSL K6-2862]|jgi:glyoxylase-like metal-dependent hydrolase (beta-lactamase superfamily II)|uniref:MBL fold metallo-hydrolase n=1 Tax=Paenibacillus sp. FSL K6-2862 TaxID=2921484 RepID=UPI0030FBB25F
MLTTTKVELHLGAAGLCTHPEFLTIRGGSLRPVPFPAGFACIIHPVHGPMLLDTGYSSRFFKETAHLPNALYRHITPVVYREEDSAVQFLARLGLKAADIRFIILSHFHGDHIAGVRDFPEAQFIYLPQAYEAVRPLGPVAAVKAGFLSGLLPGDFADRSLPVMRQSERWTKAGDDFPFSEVYDLFGDGSLLGVEVSGHAEGMMGILLSTGEQDYFLCADAVWSSRAFREQRRPHALAGIIMSDRSEYRMNFDKLVRLHQQFPEIRIVPSHCLEALNAWGTGGNYI